MPVVESLGAMIARKAKTNLPQYRNLLTTKQHVDEDELLCEVMILVHDVMDLYPDVDVDSAEFDAILRRAVTNKVIDIVRFRKRRGTSSLDAMAAEPEAAPASLWWLDVHPDPSTLADFRDKLARTEKRLPASALPLWRSLVESCEDSSRSQFDEVYEINHSRGLQSGKYRWTLGTLAYKLNVSERSIRESMKLIKLAVSEVFGVVAR